MLVCNARHQVARRPWSCKGGRESGAYTHPAAVAQDRGCGRAGAGARVARQRDAAVPLVQQHQVNLKLRALVEDLPVVDAAAALSPGAV